MTQVERKTEDVQVRENIVWLSCVVFLITAASLYLWRLDWTYLFTVKAVVFVVVGMFASALVAGMGSYVVYRALGAIIGLGPASHIGLVLVIAGTIWFTRAAFAWAYR